MFVLDMPAYPEMLLVTDLGARVPLMLTSRADSAGSRLASAALALRVAHGRRTGASAAVAGA